MGRYRPPPKPSSPYITSGGFELLRREERQLWLRRREVTKALSAAAAEGDRSENAEYIYRKKELREIDRRIRYLQKRLPMLKVVTAPPDSRDRIFFAAWVRLENDMGEEFRYRLVGADEIGHETGYISIESPLAKALLKHTLDDEVVVRTPNGETRYWVTDIEYVTD
jgi:transcription elongation factor GreB